MLADARGFNQLHPVSGQVMSHVILSESMAGQVAGSDLRALPQVYNRYKDIKGLPLHSSH
eukprot:750597-Hanusia_phi.AAC.1